MTNLLGKLPITKPRKELWTELETQRRHLYRIEAAQLLADALSQYRADIAVLQKNCWIRKCWGKKTIFIVVVTQYTKKSGKKIELSAFKIVVVFSF